MELESRLDALEQRELSHLNWRDKVDRALFGYPDPVTLRYVDGLVQQGADTAKSLKRIEETSVKGIWWIVKIVGLSALVWVMHIIGISDTIVSGLAGIYGGHK